MSKFTCHSEFLSIDSVFLKSASDAFICDFKLAEEWKSLNYTSKPDYDTSIYEYQYFQNIITNVCSELILLKRDKLTQIDSIYCRDASIATDFGMILCEMGKEGRKDEPEAQLENFNEHNIPILGRIKTPGTLEGGDVCWLNEMTLAVGLSYRTNINGIEQLKSFLESKGVKVITVDLPHYKGADDVFHLMSILSPVDKDLAVVYSPLIPISFRNYLIETGFELIEVPESEFETMGCNVLALAPRHCLMVEGNVDTQKKLEKAGCKVQLYSGQEISIKGGGGPTCLTRPYRRIKELHF